MFQPWRRQIDAARELAALGRLDEARSILSRRDLRSFWPAKQLQSELAEQLLARAAQAGTMAGCRDVQAARELGADPNAADQTVQELATRRVAEARRMLLCLAPSATLELLSVLGADAEVSAEVRSLRRAAEFAESALREAACGRYELADRAWMQAIAWLPGEESLESARERCTVEATACREAEARLHTALAERHWTAVLTAAADVLRVAPLHAVAQQAQRRAWQAAAQTSPGPRAPAGALVAAAPQPPSRERYMPGPRMLLWIDGVGGYLLCAGERVVIGQPLASSNVDIAIWGDISREHAAIVRDGDNYLLQPLRSLAGASPSAPRLLRDGDIVDLGGGVKLRFRQPHPLSRTARLDVVSRHAVAPAVDAILLVAESCILGPAGNSHVVCPDWAGQVVLCRDGDGWACLAADPYEVDGRPCDGRTLLGPSSRVSGADFALSLEPCAPSK